MMTHTRHSSSGLFVFNHPKKKCFIFFFNPGVTDAPAQHGGGSAARQANGGLSQRCLPDGGTRPKQDVLYMLCHDSILYILYHLGQIAAPTIAGGTKGVKAAAPGEKTTLAVAQKISGPAFASVCLELLCVLLLLFVCLFVSSFSANACYAYLVCVLCIRRMRRIPPRVCGRALQPVALLALMVW